jgi:DNA-directed RNA polymerase specialized sigma24 family protein
MPPMLPTTLPTPLTLAKRENRSNDSRTRSGSSDIESGARGARAKEPGATVAVALRGLAPELRAAIVETYFRGRTAREAATVLGVSPELVKARLYRAMRALNSALSESEVMPAA